MAQYRVGQYQQALEALSRSDKLNAIQFLSSLPTNLAFLAMTYHQLGQNVQAQETLRRLQELMKNKPWTNTEKTQASRREAEELLQ
jgi:tetratricopeptide (TPR) repeat protein